MKPARVGAVPEALPELLPQPGQGAPGIQFRHGVQPCRGVVGRWPLTGFDLADHVMRHKGPGGKLGLGQPGLGAVVPQFGAEYAGRRAARSKSFGNTASPSAPFGTGPPGSAGRRARRAGRGWVTWFTIGAPAQVHGVGTADDHLGHGPYRQAVRPLPPSPSAPSSTVTVRGLIPGIINSHAELRAALDTCSSRPPGARSPDPKTPPDDRACCIGPAAPGQRPRRLWPTFSALTALPVFTVPPARSIGVLSVAHGLSVWCDGRQLWWHRDGNRLTWPAGDPAGAARLLASSATPANRPRTLWQPLATY